MPNAVGLNGSLNRSTSNPVKHSLQDGSCVCQWYQSMSSIELWQLTNHMHASWEHINWTPFTPQCTMHSSLLKLSLVGKEREKCNTSRKLSIIECNFVQCSEAGYCQRINMTIEWGVGNILIHSTFNQNNRVLCPKWPFKSVTLWWSQDSIDTDHFSIHGTKMKSKK